jgi:8-amino-7-oxononanoate synthase
MRLTADVGCLTGIQQSCILWVKKQTGTERTWSMEFIQEELQKLRKEGLLRTLRTVESPQGKEITIAGRPYLSFCSTNYLGLANDPRVKEAAAKAIEKYGWGTGSSRLISGTTRLHREMEERFARFHGAESCISFATGYMANLGTIAALVGPGDAVIVDRLDHASIIDGCRLSRARLLVYRHGDAASLENVLSGAQGFNRKLIVTDSVFSMDGDLSPLPDLVTLARHYDAMVMVDEAHAVGVMGDTGRGAVEYYGLEGQVDVLMGPLSKAFGGVGGYVVGSEALITFLQNKCRSFIYTTAPPAAACAAAVEALNIVEKEPQRREKLRENVQYLKRGLAAKKVETTNSASQIVAVMIGEAEKALALSRKLFKKNVLIPAIRPPTVPKGTSRLRIMVTSEHEKEDIDRLLNLL